MQLPLTNNVEFSHSSRRIDQLLLLTLLQAFLTIRSRLGFLTLMASDDRLNVSDDLIQHHMDQRRMDSKMLLELLSLRLELRV